MVITDQRLRDQQCVRDVLEGNAEAFRELVDRYQRKVYALVVRIVGNKSEAEDLTQQSLLEAYLSLASYDNERSFLTWISRIAINNCRDYLKSHKRREVSLNIDTAADDALYSGRIVSPEQAAERTRRAHKLERAFALLDEKYKIPLILKDGEGLSYEEIREILDLPITTLKVRVVRARTQLQNSLREIKRCATMN